MLTIQGLKDLGVNTDEGLARCLNNEAFYFRLINMALNDAAYDSLRASFDAGTTRKPSRSYAASANTAPRNAAAVTVGARKKP